MNNLTQEEFDIREKELEKKLTSMHYFFKEIEAHSQNIKQAEELYKELKQYIDATKAGGSFTAKIDKAKLYENLIRLRIGIGDMYSKRSNVVVTFGNFNLRKGKDETDTNNFKEVVRKLQETFEHDKTIREAYDERISNAIHRESSSIRSRESIELDKRLSDEFKRGNISLTKNEVGMIYESKGVEIVYDVSKKEFRALYIKEDRLLSDDEYPRERYPQHELSEIKGSKALTKDGKEIRIYVKDDKKK